MDETIESTENVIYKIVYSTTYTLSYCIIFPTMFIAKSIPTNNAFINGILDGAYAANDKIKLMKKI
jgi:hypothetical protein